MRSGQCALQRLRRSNQARAPGTQNAKTFPATHMHIEPRYYVQSTEDHTFLRADGEGGIDYVPLITSAMPFTSAEAAADAVVDHCGGEGVVFRCYQLERD